MAKDDVSAKVAELLEAFLAEDEHQLEIYRIQYKKEGPDWVLRVFLDKTADAESEYIDIEECELVTRFLSDKLDELDFIDRSYKLEVSSPGLDRELIKESDYTRFAGRLVEVKLYEALGGAKFHEAELCGKEGDVVSIKLANGETLEIPTDKISKINLAVVF